MFSVKPYPEHDQMCERPNVRTWLARWLASEWKEGCRKWSTAGISLCVAVSLVSCACLVIHSRLQLFASSSTGRFYCTFVHLAQRAYIKPWRL